MKAVRKNLRNVAKEFLHATALALLLGAAAPANAQTAVPQSAPVYSQQQIDQLLAPIALYPDPLLSQILMAATYPLEVVEAYRWQTNPSNAGLQGDDLTEALEQQPWDPSVKSLVSTPQVLKILDDNIEWTEQLGDVFLAQQAAVMDSVQRLRQQAEAAGTLRSTPQQIVETQDSEIEIEPADSGVIYVPAYNPMVVYGAWPYPGYAPYYFSDVTYAGAAIGFGLGFFIGDALWGWDHWDWRRHHIDIDARRFSELNRGRPPIANSGVWQHDPAHRGGVPYRDVATRAHFQGVAAASPSAAANRAFRGYQPNAAPQISSRPNVAGTNRMVGGGGRPVSANIQPQSTPAFRGVEPVRPVTPVRPVEPARPVEPVRNFVAPQRPSVPVSESFSRGADVRVQSARGAFSRASAPPPQNSPHAQPPAQQGGGGHGGENFRR